MVHTRGFPESRWNHKFRKHSKEELLEQSDKFKTQMTPWVCKHCGAKQVGHGYKVVRVKKSGTGLIRYCKHCGSEYEV